MVWSIERAQAWYAAQSATTTSWKVGMNFIPSDAVNQIAMWQDYNTTTIERELSWAAQLHYNTLRVFLHDQMFTAQGTAFLDKVDAFLDTAHSLGFQTILVLLEGIWDPNPQYTPGHSQPAPRPFVHNSRWLQSPGAAALANDTALQTLIKPYVQAIVYRFGNDTRRVLLLDLMDQPDNCNLLSYGNVGLRVPATEDAYGTEWEPSIKLQLIQQFIPQLLEWVQQADPHRQVPVTLADWHADADLEGPLGDVQKELRHFYVHNVSDIVTFHHYGPNVLDKLQALQQETAGRPIVLSSFMSRDDGSTLNPILGDMYMRGVWALHWGFVAGQTQTIWNADSWNERYASYPNVWHHDLLWPNGTAYDQSEIDYLLSLRNASSNQNTTIHNHSDTETTNNPDTTQGRPPQMEKDGDSSSPTTRMAQWGVTSINVVGTLGLVALVLTCAWFVIANRQRRRQRRDLSISFQPVDHAEALELKEFS